MTTFFINIGRQNIEVFYFDKEVNKRVIINTFIVIF